MSGEFIVAGLLLLSVGMISKSSSKAEEYAEDLRIWLENEHRKERYYVASTPTRKAG